MTFTENNVENIYSRYSSHRHTPAKSLKAGTTILMTRKMLTKQDQQLSSDTSKNWSHRTNRSPEETGKQNCSLTGEETASGVSSWHKTWRVTEELLGAWPWGAKIPGLQPYRAPTHPGEINWIPRVEIGEKPLMLPAEGGKNEPFWNMLRTFSSS